MADIASNKLEGLLGFDPTKRETLTQELFKEVVQEISKERTDKAKAQAKEHLTKAIQLREGMVKARRDFDREDKKFEKELGKVMNQIQGVLTGQEPHEEGGACEKEASE